MTTTLDLPSMKDLLNACLAENCETPKVFAKAVDDLFEVFSVETISSLITEIERLKKFEDWFARLETATTAIDESFRDERDVALFSVFWAARLYMVPSEVTESGDEEFCEKIIRSGAETLMVGGRRLLAASEKDANGRPIIPFDYEYRSRKEASQ